MFMQHHKKSPAQMLPVQDDEPSTSLLQRRHIQRLQPHNRLSEEDPGDVVFLDNGTYPLL